MSDKAMAVKWDKRSAVDDLISKEKGVVLVGVAQTWNGCSMQTAVDLEALRTTKQNAVPVFILDSDQADNRTREWGISTTPAIVFLLNGSPVTIRRSDVPDNKFYVGQLERGRLQGAMNIAQELNQEEGTAIVLDLSDIPIEEASDF